jgi:hypothetical protein
LAFTCAADLGRIPPAKNRWQGVIPKTAGFALFYFRHPCPKERSRS